MHDDHLHGLACACAQACLAGKHPFAAFHECEPHHARVNPCTEVRLLASFRCLSHSHSYRQLLPQLCQMCSFPNQGRPRNALRTHPPWHFLCNTQRLHPGLQIQSPSIDPPQACLYQHYAKLLSATWSAMHCHTSGRIGCSRIIQQTRIRAELLAGPCMPDTRLRAKGCNLRYKSRAARNGTLARQQCLCQKQPMQLGSWRNQGKAVHKISNQPR